MILDPALSGDALLTTPCGMIIQGTDGEASMCVFAAPAAEVYGMPVHANAPACETSNTDANGDLVLLVNPAENGETVYYVIRNASYQLASGEQRDHGPGKHGVAFDRGGQFGRARYTLAAGAFRFKVAERG